MHCVNNISPKLIYFFFTTKFWTCKKPIIANKQVFFIKSHINNVFYFADLEILRKFTPIKL